MRLTLDRATLAAATAATSALILTVCAGVAAAETPTQQGQPAFSSQPPPAVPGAPVTDTGRRPRVGLVLAGGGAKGGAHVGVLKVLEQMHVPVDCIAGTSMGALVGGGYASGINAAGMEHFLLGIDWPKVVGGVGQWEKQPIEQKRGGVTYSNQLDMGLKDKHVVMPPGLIDTSGIDDLLRTYVAQSRNVSNFDQLPIPYRAVATDMVSGQMVVLSDGDLATAMRASMAIPGAFAPVRLGDYILNDGGMVRNLPIDVARNVCADVVIAVNLVTEPIKPDNLQTATQLAGRAMDVMLEANVRLQLQTLKPGDVLVNVYVGDIGTADFTRVPDTIPLGEKAARAVADQLARYAVPEPEFMAWRERVTKEPGIRCAPGQRRIQGPRMGEPGIPCHAVQTSAPATSWTASASVRKPARCRRSRTSNRSATSIDGRSGEPDAEVVAEGEELGPELPQVRPRPLRIRGRRLRLRVLPAAGASLAEFAGTAVAQRGAARLQHHAVVDAVPATRHRAAVLRANRRPSSRRPANTSTTTTNASPSTSSGLRRGRGPRPELRPTARN